MPTVIENIRRWKGFDWSNRGQEWCDGFGGPDKCWEDALLPRVGHYLPTGHILELGPGYGVWTQRLRPLSTHMTLVDLAPNCIKDCRKRFGKQNMTYHVNDGRSLDMVEDGTIDFVFSFNSLVHADHEVMAAYIAQLATKMKPGAFGFLHHSNLGVYAAELGQGQADFEHWRGRDMTAEKLREDCRGAGLVCVFQELVPWGSPKFVDAISLIAKPGGDSATGQGLVERETERNSEFWHQARAGDHSPGAWYTATSCIRDQL